MTSKLLRMVTYQRSYAVDWRFISLRLINAEVDYDTHFPQVGFPGLLEGRPGDGSRVSHDRDKRLRPADETKGPTRCRASIPQGS